MQQAGAAPLQQVVAAQMQRKGQGPMYSQGRKGREGCHVMGHRLGHWGANGGAAGSMENVGEGCEGKPCVLAVGGGRPLSAAPTPLLHAVMGMAQAFWVQVVHAGPCMQGHSSPGN